jgi:predicted small metal-binding protein
MLKFKCRDVGFDCGFTAKVKTCKYAIHAKITAKSLKTSQAI